MTWGERNGVAVIAQESGDPAAVVFDAINAARARNIDIVLADTAGRLPTQLHLMEEIAKARRVVQKAEPTGPHEVLLVLDANIGQNALQQVKAFDAAIGVTGLVVTKSTAPPRAAWWRRSPASARSRCASSAWASRSTTCRPSAPRSSGRAVRQPGRTNSRAEPAACTGLDSASAGK